MLREEQVSREVDYIMQSDKIKVVSVGTTARLLADFLVLPRREYMQFACINFLVSNQVDAAYCLDQADGIADYILVDVEAKQDVKLMDIAVKHVSKSTLVSFKPNDASVEAADLLIRQHFHEDLTGRRILILGAGNISSKLALRFCERNAHVELHARNYSKVKMITDGLNAILPKYSGHRIEPIERVGRERGYYDGIVSFIAADQIADKQIAEMLHAGGIAVDGGINNFTPEFIEECQSQGITCNRLDVRLGFIYSLLSLGHDVHNFYTNVRGERYVDHNRLIAGGIIGRRGDVIVDRMVHPSQIIGIANGVGGVLSPCEYTNEEHGMLDELEEKLFGEQKHIHYK